MKLYNVDFDCPRCGKIHAVWGGPGCDLRTENGPDRAGSVAELYGGQQMPDVLAKLMNHQVWCERAALGLCG